MLFMVLLFSIGAFSTFWGTSYSALTVSGGRRGVQNSQERGGRVRFQAVWLGWVFGLLSRFGGLLEARRLTKCWCHIWGGRYIHMGRKSALVVCYLLVTSVMIGLVGETEGRRRGWDLLSWLAFIASRHWQLCEYVTSIQYTPSILWKALASRYTNYAYYQVRTEQYLDKIACLPYFAGGRRAM